MRENIKKAQRQYVMRIIPNKKKLGIEISSMDEKNSGFEKQNSYNV